MRNLTAALVGTAAIAILVVILPFATKSSALAEETTRNQTSQLLLDSIQNTWDANADLQPDE